MHAFKPGTAPGQSRRRPERVGSGGSERSVARDALKDQLYTNGQPDDDGDDARLSPTLFLDGGSPGPEFCATPREGFSAEAPPPWPQAYVAETAMPAGMGLSPRNSVRRQPVRSEQSQMLRGLLNSDAMEARLKKGPPARARARAAAAAAARARAPPPRPTPTPPTPAPTKRGRAARARRRCALRWST